MGLMRMAAISGVYRAKGDMGVTSTQNNYLKSGDGLGLGGNWSVADCNGPTKGDMGVTTVIEPISRDAFRRSSHVWIICSEKPMAWLPPKQFWTNIIEITILQG